MTEAANTITIEARSVGDAVRQAARQLDVDASLVNHKLDLSHFRNEDGRSVPRDTVKIIAWARDPSETKGAMAAREWLAELIEKMGIKAKVSVMVPDAKTADLRVDTEQARHLVGRRGVTLYAIKELLEAAMSKEYGDWTLRIDVQGGEEQRHGRDERRDDRRDDRRDRGGRYDRGGRHDRGGRNDRGDRGDRHESRGRGRDRHSGGGRRHDGDGDGRSERDLDKLRRLASRLAQEALDTGEPVEIRRQLNSFERRVVHLVISDIDGVVTESVGEGPHKSVVIKAAGGDGVAADA